MTDDSSFDFEVNTAEEFERLIGHLLVAAYEGGVDPSGSWVHRGEDEVPDWEAVITELKKEK